MQPENGSSSGKDPDPNDEQVLIQDKSYAVHRDRPVVHPAA